MIEYRTGDVLAAHDCQALVNPVNCVGVMGRGLALAFARHYPEILPDYRRACRDRDLRPGVTRIHHVSGPPARYVVSFPTKDHWRTPSQIEWIEQGMESLMQLLDDHGISSVAVPALGAGLGGLPWDSVKPIIVRHAELHPHVRTVIITLPRYG